MGRRARIHFAGAVYHAMARGVNGCPIFVDDDDHRQFLGHLALIRKESGAEVLAYCLMGNHFHLAIRVGLVPLSAIMQRTLTSYSQRFNEKHDRKGHLFQARYKAILCLNDSYLWQLTRYIHENPVRAGLVATPEEWEWSSVGTVARRSVSMANFDPWAEMEKIDVDLLRSEDRAIELEIIAERVAAREGLEVEALRARTKNRAVVVAKRRMAQESVREGYSLTEIARWLGVGRNAVSAYCAIKSGNLAA